MAWEGGGLNTGRKQIELTKMQLEEGPFQRSQAPPLLEALAARLRTRLTPVPQLAAREGLGAPSAEACGPGDSQLCAYTWGLGARRDEASGASGEGTAPRR